MAEIPYALYLAALAGFGLLFGSFANVVIWRLPRGESLVAPASHCPKCETPIAWRDNIPVVSWLLLRGRCRHCGAAISARYPIVEALSGGLWLLAGVTYGISLRALAGVVLFYGLLVLTYIDIDHQRLPNTIVGALALAGGVGVAVSEVYNVALVPLVGTSEAGAVNAPLVAALWGALLGGGTSFGIASLYALVRGKSGLGMGDVKLLAVMGLFLGPYVLLALVAGSVLGSVYGLTVAHRSGQGVSTRIPFGPFLAAGGVLAATIGPSLWSWYARLVGVA